MLHTFLQFRHYFSHIQCQSVGHPLVGGESMLIKNIKPCLVSSIAIATCISSAHALESMTAKQLGQECGQIVGGSVTAEGSICSAYLQGYISANPYVRIVDGSEPSFAERAIRTRAPGGSSSVEAMRLGRYCLPNDLSTVALAEKVVSETAYREGASAGALLKRVLESNYAC